MKNFNTFKTKEKQKQKQVKQTTGNCLQNFHQWLYLFKFSCSLGHETPGYLKNIFYFYSVSPSLALFFKLFTFLLKHFIIDFFFPNKPFISPQIKYFRKTIYINLLVTILKDNVTCAEDSGQRGTVGRQSSHKCRRGTRCEVRCVFSAVCSRRGLQLVCVDGLAGYQIAGCDKTQVSRRINRPQVTPSSCFPLLFSRHRL